MKKTGESALPFVACIANKTEGGLKPQSPMLKLNYFDTSARVWWGGFGTLSELTDDCLSLIKRNVVLLDEDNSKYFDQMVPYFFTEENPILTESIDFHNKFAFLGNLLQEVGSGCAKYAEILLPQLFDGENAARLKAICKRENISDVDTDPAGAAPYLLHGIFCCLEDKHPLWQKYQIPTIDFLFSVCGGDEQFFDEENEARVFSSTFFLFGYLTEEKYVLQAMELMDAYYESYAEDSDFISLNNAIWATSILIGKFTHLFKDEAGNWSEIPGMLKFLTDSIAIVATNHQEPTLVETCWELLEAVVKKAPGFITTHLRIEDDDEARTWVLFQNGLISGGKNFDLVWELLKLVYREEFNYGETLLKFQKKIPDWKPQEK